MTDAMTPLGLSVWQMTTPRPMPEAGGRLFFDITPYLASPAARRVVPGVRAAVGPPDVGRAHHGTDLLDVIVEDFQELRRLLFDPRSHQVFTTAMDAAWWIDENLHDWAPPTRAPTRVPGPWRGRRRERRRARLP